MTKIKEQFRMVPTPLNYKELERLTLALNESCRKLAIVIASKKFYVCDPDGDRRSMFNAKSTLEEINSYDLKITLRQELIDAQADLSERDLKVFVDSYIAVKQKEALNAESACRRLRKRG